MRKHTPGRTRPARPRRCLAAACDTHVSVRREMLFSASYADSLTRSESMTTVTSSIVMLVSGGGGGGGVAEVQHLPPTPPLPTRDVGREDDLALPRRRAAEDERLLVARQAAVEV